MRKDHFRLALGEWNGGAIRTERGEDTSAITIGANTSYFSTQRKFLKIRSSWDEFSAELAKRQMQNMISLQNSDYIGLRDHTKENTSD